MALKRHKPLWKCPACGEKFSTKNQWHSCGKFDIRDLFARCDAEVLQIFKAFSRHVRQCGPVTIIPQKTRITFQVRMRFVSLYPRRKFLLGGFVFARRIENPRFFKIESFSPRNHLHHFRIRSTDELDDEFDGWIAEAYAVGRQDHWSG